MADRIYEKLVEMLQDGRIGYLDFVMGTDDREPFLQWCDDHGVEPSDDYAELYIAQTEAQVMDYQEMPAYE